MAHWEIYPTQLEDELILILVDLDWHNSDESTDLGVLNWFRTEFEPGPQPGMPTEADREQLERFNDWLAAEFDGDGHLVARLTGPGRREFFVYAGFGKVDLVLDRARSVFPGIRLSGRTRPDPQWVLYHEFLYPDAVQMARIRALQRTRLMQEDGDNLQIPRNVDHVAAFHSAEQREMFRAFAIGQGFNVVDEAESEDDTLDRPFVIRLIKSHALDPVAIEHNVVRLLVKVRELGGEYGGWVTSVVKG